MNPVFSIFTGDVKTMKLKALYANSLDPLDLTSCTEIEVSLPIAGGGFVHRKLSQSQVAITSPAPLGKFTVPLSAEISEALNVGELQDFEVKFTIGGLVTTIKFKNALSVFESP